MAKRRWFLMDRKTFEVARQACEQLQASQNQQLVLYTLWNSEMSACLVRLDGASKEWRAGQHWISSCTEVYCRSSHPGPTIIDELVNTPSVTVADTDSRDELQAALEDS